MVIWEYKAENIIRYPPLLEPALNRLAADGWELVMHLAEPRDTQVTFIFRRVKQ